MKKLFAILAVCGFAGLLGCGAEVETTDTSPATPDPAGMADQMMPVGDAETEASVEEEAATEEGAAEEGATEEGATEEGAAEEAATEEGAAEEGAAEEPSTEE